MSGMAKPDPKKEPELHPTHGRASSAPLTLQQSFKMKLPRRNFLHLAAGAAALPAVSSIARPLKENLAKEIAGIGGGRLWS
jgi:hypothetical protein